MHNYSRNLFPFSRRNAFPQEPESAATLDVPDAWMVTGQEGQRFLLHDSGPGEGRILVFATDNQLWKLARSSTWYMDGNFSCVPSIFMQVKGNVKEIKSARLPNTHRDKSIYDCAERFHSVRSDMHLFYRREHNEHNQGTGWRDQLVLQEPFPAI